MSHLAAFAAGALAGALGLALFLAWLGIHDGDPTI